MKAWLIGCCGCERLMIKGGAVAPVAGFFVSQLGIASFDSKAEADAAAIAAGWSVSVEYGHRCPACGIPAPDPPSRRGAYIHSSMLKG